MAKIKENNGKMAEVIKEEIEKKPEAQIVEVPSQYSQAIQLEDGTLINEFQLLIRIYNDVQKIKRAVA